VTAAPYPSAVADGTGGTDAWALTAVITRLRRALRTSIRSEYPWEALPMARVELLLRLRERGGVRVGELAQGLRLAPNTVSNVVQQLVEAGLVARTPDPADRRASLVRITDAGREQLAGWERAHERRIGGALDQLGEADRAAIRQALPALAHLVDRLTADPAGGG
jgi:DNA-binding MarR family transcriptional regulator